MFINDCHLLYHFLLKRWTLHPSIILAPQNIQAEFHLDKDAFYLTYWVQLSHFLNILFSSSYYVVCKNFLPILAFCSLNNTSYSSLQKFQIYSSQHHNWILNLTLPTTTTSLSSATYYWHLLILFTCNTKQLPSTPLKWHKNRMFHNHGYTNQTQFLVPSNLSCFVNRVWNSYTDCNKLNLLCYHINTG